MVPVADARSLADAIIRRLEMPFIPPSPDSPDGLPQNEGALEEADNDLLLAFAVMHGRVSVDDLIRELADLHAVAAGTGGAR